MEISNKISTTMTDKAIAEAMGEFIKYHRLKQNKTQAQLAIESGINRSTLVQVEAGRSSNVLTLIRLLRAMRQLYVLDSFEIKSQISPLLLAEEDEGRRIRASKGKVKRTRTKSDW